MANFLRSQAVSSLIISIGLLLPAIYNHSKLAEPGYKGLIYTFAVSCGFFMILSIILFYLSTKKLYSVEETVELAGEAKPNILKITVVFWIMLFLAYLFLIYVQYGNFFTGFNTYNIIMFGAIAIGTYSLSKTDINGYLILWGVVIYNLVRIINLHQWLEFVIWIYPMINLGILYRYMKTK